MFDLELAIIGIILSAIFSGSELAYISSSHLQIEVWARQKRLGASKALAMLGNTDRFMISVLMGTTLSNIVATSFATAYLMHRGFHPAAVLAIITTVILLFGEVLPKTITGEIPNRALLVLAPLNAFWQAMISPILFTGHKLQRALIQARAEPSAPEYGPAMEREDLKILFAVQNDSRVLEKSEKELISQLFDLKETPISSAMTPRTAMVTIGYDAELSEVAHMFIESGNSKLPVFKENLDSILGVVYHYDLFKSPTSLESIIQPVTMVPDSNTTLDVLRSLQQAKRSIAIVVDEYGGTAGLVTLEDLFEELFGEFEDEFDTGPEKASQLPDGTMLIAGNAEIEQLNREFNLNLPDGDYETMAGYLTSALGRIPHIGEQIHMPFGIVTIKKATLRRVEQITISPEKRKRNLKPM